MFCKICMAAMVITPAGTWYCPRGGDHIYEVEPRS